MKNRTKGLVLVTVSTLIFSSIGVFAKMAAAGPLTLLCAWMVVGFPVFFLSAFFRKTISISRRDFSLVAAVTVLLLVADGAFLTSIKLAHVPPANANFVKFLFPVIIVLAAAPIVWQRKILAVHAWSALIGLAGLAVILRPWSGWDVNFFGYACALVAAICLAFAFSLFKKIDHVSRDAFLAYRYLIGLLVLVPVVWLVKSPLTLFSPSMIWQLLAFGVFYGVVASIIDGRSFVYLDERDIGIIKYVEPLETTLFAWLFLSEAASSNVLIGGLIVIASGLLIAMRKSGPTVEVAKTEKVHI